MLRVPVASRYDGHVTVDISRPIPKQKAVADAAATEPLAFALVRAVFIELSWWAAPRTANRDGAANRTAGPGSALPVVLSVARLSHDGV